MPYVDALSTLEIDYGKRVWETLRENQAFPVKGVLWLFEPESGWRLLIVTPRVDEVGRRKAYEELGELTHKIKLSPTDQNWRVEVMSPRSAFYQALRSVFGKRDSVEGTRLGSTQFEGMYVEDGYLYQVK
jgi:hypothetical protein